MCVQKTRGREYYLSELRYNGQIGELSLCTDEFDHKISFFEIKDPESEEVKRLPASQIFDEIILLKIKDYEVIKLRSEDFNLSYGGNFTLDYLYNGLSNKRKQIELELTPSFEIQFDGEKVFSMRFIENKFLGQIVGIKKVIFND